MNYSPEDIRNGQQIKIQANETPSSFASMDGAAPIAEPSFTPPINLPRAVKPNIDPVANAITFDPLGQAADYSSSF